MGGDGEGDSWSGKQPAPHSSSSQMGSEIAHITLPDPWGTLNRRTETQGSSQFNMSLPLSPMTSQLQRQLETHRRKGGFNSSFLAAMMANPFWIGSQVTYPLWASTVLLQLYLVMGSHETPFGKARRVGPANVYHHHLGSDLLVGNRGGSPVRGRSS